MQQLPLSRSGTGRFAAPWAALRRDGAIGCGLLLLGLVTRAPLVGSTLAGWDSVQYALGLVDFDVVRHQPHPPGSLLYVLLGRLLLGLTGDAQAALAAISVLAGAVSLALCYLTGKAIFGWRVAAAGTLVYATSPLTWYYGVVALPYALEGALTLGAVALLWRAAEGRRVGPALGAAALLALAGGIRQTTMLLLLPLWLQATWRACALPAPAALLRGRSAWRGWWPAGWGLVVGLGLLAALCAVWVVPLLVLSGGPGAYLTASRRLSSLVGGLTSVLTVGPAAIAANASYVADVVAMGLTLAVAPFAVFLLPRVSWPWRPTPGQAWFLWLWAAPALLVYLTLHIGQAGYVLLLWPLVCYGAGTAALAAGELLDRTWPALGGRGTALLLGAVGLAGTVVFLCAPLVARTPGTLTWGAIREQDDTWRSVTEAAGTFQPGSLAILTGTQARESFRLATYYLPEVPVYAIGLDRQGELGVAFAGHNGVHSYAGFMAGAGVRRMVPLAPGTTRLLILDESVMRLFPAHSLTEIALTPARRAWLWPDEAGGAGLSELRVRAPLGDD